MPDPSVRVKRNVSVSYEPIPVDPDSLTHEFSAFRQIGTAVNCRKSREENSSRDCGSYGARRDLSNRVGSVENGTSSDSISPLRATCCAHVS